MHLQSIFISEGVNDLTPYSLSNSLKNFGILCELPFTGELCKTVLFNMFGPSVQYFDGFLLNLSKHYPAGSSYKQFIHYGQLIATGNKFNRIPGTAKTEEFSFKELCVNFIQFPFLFRLRAQGNFKSSIIMQPKTWNCTAVKWHPNTIYHEFPLKYTFCMEHTTN